MKIFLVGNGINIALGSDESKYNIFTGEVDNFLRFIGFLEKDFQINSFHFGDFMRWLGESNHDKNSKKVYSFYSKFSNNKCYDIELLFQLYVSSKKFRNLPHNKSKKLETWAESLKERVSQKLKNIDDIFSHEIAQKVNKEYDLIVTTNYDFNLEKSGVNNVYHIHGNINNPKLIELVTFKKYETLLSIIEQKISKSKKSHSEDIVIDIYGLDLFNELHILKALFKLKLKYKSRLKINHYIFSNSNSEFEEKDISNLYLNYFFGLKWKSEIKTYEFPFSEGVYKRLLKTTQFSSKNDENTFLDDETIQSFLKWNSSFRDKKGVKSFKFVINFCKNIKTFPHSLHFINAIDSRLVHSTIEMDLTEIESDDQ